MHLSGGWYQRRKNYPLVLPLGDEAKPDWKLNQEDKINVTLNNISKCHRMQYIVHDLNTKCVLQKVRRAGSLSDRYAGDEW